MLWCNTPFYYFESPTTGSNHPVKTMAAKSDNRNTAFLDYIGTHFQDLLSTQFQQLIDFITEITNAK